MKPLFHKDITHNTTDLTITAIMAQRLDVQNQPEAPCSRLAADIQFGSFHRTHLDTHLDTRRSFRGALTPEYNTSGDRFAGLSYLDTRGLLTTVSRGSHTWTPTAFSRASHTPVGISPPMSLRASGWFLSFFLSTLCFFIVSAISCRH